MGVATEEVHECLILIVDYVLEVPVAFGCNSIGFGDCLRKQDACRELSSFEFHQVASNKEVLGGVVVCCFIVNLGIAEHGLNCLLGGLDRSTSGGLVRVEHANGEARGFHVDVSGHVSSTEELDETFFTNLSLPLPSGGVNDVEGFFGGVLVGKEFGSEQVQLRVGVGPVRCREEGE